MTQEQKELLIKDLCGRLYYGIFVEENRDSLDKGPVVYTIDYHPYINDCKPYLRPMESMTEEEEKEWHATFESVYNLVPGGDPDNEDDYDDNWHEEPGIESYDYLNAHHFDYRGLIPMGLALPAPEGMYNE
jgi:hypothetical protein